MAAMTGLPSLGVLTALLRIDVNALDDANDVEALVALLVQRALREKRKNAPPRRLHLCVVR